MSAKKALYALFFFGDRVAIKVLVEKDKSITGKYYIDVVLKKLKKYYQKRRQVTGSRLLHDNASAIVTAFFEERKSNCFASPFLLLDLATCDFFMFPKLNSLLGGNTSPEMHLDLPFISTL